MAASSPRDPAALPPGTVIGSWRVVSRCGEGSYGIVYQVEKVKQPEAGPFALKLAQYPMDPRFEREVELLWRGRHAHVPRLHDYGRWTHPDGVSFPYLVMDWIEGVPLYVWAARRRLSSRQVPRVLAQLARALEALHGESGVHRDVKGGNILVTEEAQAFLTDYGSGLYPEARELTREPVPPGTPQYWSPESLRFQWRFRRSARARYKAGAADDVYALGVTAYRLVTGTYPPPAEGPESTEDDTEWTFGVRVSPEALVGACPELASVICQMLADEPSARGSAGEVARALEYAARSAGSKADRPIPQRTPDTAPVRSARPVRMRRALVWGLGLAAPIMGLGLVLLVREPEPWQSVQAPAAVAEAPRREEEQRDGGTAGMAEAVLTARVDVAPPGTEQEGLSLAVPKEPLPGQR
ncbi:MAG: serine/threonine protein kinase, partial [Myxococcaceae bacterium]|nr:serine/threonine protein kinase [Myxococcaceae bacterium]